MVRPGFGQCIEDPILDLDEREALVLQPDAASGLGQLAVQGRATIGQRVLLYGQNDLAGETAGGVGHGFYSKQIRHRVPHPSNANLRCRSG